MTNKNSFYDSKTWSRSGECEQGGESASYQTDRRTLGYMNGGRIVQSRTNWNGCLVRLVCLVGLVCLVSLVEQDSRV